MDYLQLYENLIVLALALPRMLALMAMVPVFNKTVLPGSIQRVIALSFVLVIQPVVAQSVDPAALTFGLLMTIIIKEIVIGVLLGAGIGLVFWAVESFGFLIDNQRGSTMASSLDPLTGSQTSPLGIFMTQVITVFYMVSGAFMLTLYGVYESYALYPVGSFFPDVSLDKAIYFLNILDRIFTLALVLAAPAMIAMFLSEFGLGLVSRFAPQLNVFFLAMPVKSAVGILMLVLYIGLLPPVWRHEFEYSLTHVELLGRLLR